jgi:hypothetical protein
MLLSWSLRIAKTYPQEVVVFGLLDHCDEAKERGRSREHKEATRRAKIRRSPKWWGWMGGERLNIFRIRGAEKG